MSANKQDEFFKVVFFCAVGPVYGLLIGDAKVDGGTDVVTKIVFPTVLAYMIYELGSVALTQVPAKISSFLKVSLTDVFILQFSLCFYLIVGPR